MNSYKTKLGARLKSESIKLRRRRPSLNKLLRPIIRHKNLRRNMRQSRLKAHINHRKRKNSI